MCIPTWLQNEQIYVYKTPASRLAGQRPTGYKPTGESAKSAFLKRENLENPENNRKLYYKHSSFRLQFFSGYIDTENARKSGGKLENPSDFLAFSVSI